MKFGPLAIKDAEGAVLAHSTRAGGTRLRKAELVKQEYSNTANYSLPLVLWDKKTDSAANPEQKMALLLHAVNVKHAARAPVAGGSSKSDEPLVAEKFGGKSFFDPNNNLIDNLLDWAPPAETDAETDAE